MLRHCSMRAERWSRSEQALGKKKTSIHPVDAKAYLPPPLGVQRQRNDRHFPHRASGDLLEEDLKSAMHQASF